MRYALMALAALLLLAAPARAEQGDTLVLLHGLGRTKGAMEKMEKYFTGMGYTVINVDYDSRNKDLVTLAKELDALLDEKGADKAPRLHLVGHSMGGLVIRAYVHKHRPANLGRVVHLGTPNRGSEVADFLSGTALFEMVYGPAGAQLVTDQSKVKDVLGPVDFPLGIIAGDRSIDPVSSWGILPGRDDGKVTIARTKVKGMTDHITLHATHTFMSSNDEVIAQTAFFLENGGFRRAPE